jgi:NTP pyrophosphatase (non-canonical NTP hydrolase)
MNFNQYQERAHKTAIYPTDISLEKYSPNGNYYPPTPNLKWIYPALGLSAETGELMNKLKKVIRDKNGDIDSEMMLDIKDEMGDILWYISELCNSLNLDLETIASMNLAKLAQRAMHNQIHGDKR